MEIKTTREEFTKFMESTDYIYNESDLNEFLEQNYIYNKTLKESKSLFLGYMCGVY